MELRARAAGIDAEHNGLRERVRTVREELKEVSSLVAKARLADASGQSKGAKKKRGKGGKGGVSASTKSELAELQWQTMTARQALDKANAELAVLRSEASKQDGASGKAAEALARAQAQADAQARAVAEAEQQVQEVQVGWAACVVWCGGKG